MSVFSRVVKISVVAVLLALPAMAMSADDHSTVNKSIKLGANTVAGDIESVNGSVRVGEGSSVSSIEAVNGAINIGPGVGIERGVRTVNGSVSLDSDCEVGGNIETVNGAIKLERTMVSGDIETVNGQLRILDGSEVTGDVLVRENKSWGWSKRKPIHVEIGENVVVHGNLVFKQPVRLSLHESARVGEIIGDDVEMTDGS